MRTLLLLLIGALVWWLGRLAGRSSSALTLRTRAKSSAAGPQTLVACAHCGVQQPRSEALFDAAGRPYCCAEHRDAARRASLKT
ncbi:MAG: PP0621 family protein [Leptothrix ochracea]|uniref:PP0621 family protein n=1 Tax=Leptothrix ochracea TaxID=735331 RepID=UPI0034E1C4B3